jgi:hypothetical protein
MLILKKTEKETWRKRDNCDSLQRIESSLFFIIHDQEAAILTRV